MNSSNNSNTVCAQLTAPGRGAVAVIGVSGPASEKAIEKSFRPFGGRNYSSTSERNIVYGVWRSSNEDLHSSPSEDWNDLKSIATAVQWLLRRY